MPPEKIQVSARIPKPLYDSCMALYDNMTAAVIDGLELIVSQSENKCNSTETTCNTGETSELRARLEEKEKLIIVLKEELAKASQREEDLKTMHNNYMLQVQSLINQKAIDGPGQKRWYEFWK